MRFSFWLWERPFGQTTKGPEVTGVVNSAGGAASIESGSWVSIYGTNLAATTRSWQASDFSGDNLPTTLDNVTVTIDGKKAAIAYVSPGQLNVQAPADTATGTVPVQVTNSAARPAGRQRCRATRRRSSPTSRNTRRHDTIAMGPTSRRPDISEARSLRGRRSPGESFQIYATGLGPTTPAVAAGQLVAAPAPCRTSPNYT